jgi:hypothetical protein
MAESGVGLLLVVLGGMLALKLFRERWHLHRHVHDGEPHVHLHSHRRREDHVHPHWARQSLRPLLIGMAHGVAGSAALMLVIVSNTRGIGQGLLYIAVFGLGSIGGMLMVGLALSVPVIYSRAIGQRAFFAGARSGEPGKCRVWVVDVVSIDSLSGWPVVSVPAVLSSNELRVNRFDGYGILQSRAMSAWHGCSEVLV